MNNIRLGDVLIDFGYITQDQLQAALAYQKEHKNLRVGQALQELGYVNERQVLEALAQRLHLRVIDFTQINADISAVEKVPRELAQKYDMLPIAREVERRLKDCHKPITVAVMGCVVNGPGEAAAADVGIAGGRGEGLLFAKGKILRKVPQEQLVDELFREIEKL